MKGNNEVAALGVIRVVTVQLEGPLKMVDSHAGTGSRAAHRAKARTPVQPTREMPVTMEIAGLRITLREARSQNDHDARDDQS